MHDLYNLRDKLCKELKEYGTKDLSASSLEIVDKLAHAIKNMDKIIEKNQMDEYSYRSGYSRDMGGYSRDMDGYSRESGYSNGRDVTRDFVRPDGSYRHDAVDMSYARGRTGRVARDSMGRYSKDDGLHEDIRRLMDMAPDERTRDELRKLMERL